MKKQIILYLLILSGVLGYSQSKRTILSNQVEVEFVQENRKGTQIVLEIEKRPKCFQDMVTTEVIDKVLDDYSERSSYPNTQIKFYKDKIEYDTDAGYEKAIIDFKNQLQYFNIGSSKVYITELNRFSKEKAIKSGGMEECVLNEKYPDFSYPLLKRNISSKNIQEISDRYKNTIGINNIKIQITGKIDVSEAVLTFEKWFKQLNLKKVDLNCKKVTVSDSAFLIYKPFKNIDKGVETYSIYTQNEEISSALKQSLIQTFGKDHVKINSFDNFSEVHITQKAKDANGKKLLENLKTLAKDYRLDYTKFGTVVSGDANKVFESFKDENITYLNERGDTILNPFVYGNIGFTGKEIIDKYLDAVGDQELIKSIQNTRSRYSVVVNNDTLNLLRVEFLNVLPYKKLRKTILNGDEISYNVFDGHNGWINKKGMLRDYDKEEISESLVEETVFPQQFYSTEKISVEGLIKEEDEKYEDQYYYKIKVSLDDYIVYEYYDPVKGFLMKREFCKDPQIPIRTIYYSSYTKLKKLKIPHRLRLLEDNQELKLTLVNFKYNSFIEPEEFAKIDHFKSSPQAKIFNQPSETRNAPNNAETESHTRYSEPPNPFEGVEMDSEVTPPNQTEYVEDQRKIDESRKRSIKYLLVLAATTQEKEAEGMLKKLKEKGFSQAEIIEMNGRYYTVEGGVYSTKEEAHKKLNEVHKKNPGTWILKREY